MRCDLRLFRAAPAAFDAAVDDVHRRAEAGLHVVAEVDRVGFHVPSMAQVIGGFGVCGVTANQTADAKLSQLSATRSGWSSSTLTSLYSASENSPKL